MKENIIADLTIQSALAFLMICVFMGASIAVSAYAGHIVTDRFSTVSPLTAADRAPAPLNAGTNDDNLNDFVQHDVPARLADAADLGQTRTLIWLQNHGYIHLSDFYAPQEVARPALTAKRKNRQ